MRVRVPIAALFQKQRKKNTGVHPLQCVRTNDGGKGSANMDAHYICIITHGGGESNTQYTKRKTHNTTKPQPAGVPRIVLRVCMHVFATGVGRGLFGGQSKEPNGKRGLVTQNKNNHPQSKTICFFNTPKNTHTHVHEYRMHRNTIAQMHSFPAFSLSLSLSVSPRKHKYWWQ